MSGIQAAKRRRRQAKIGYRHLAKLGRPIYKKKSASKAARQLQRVIAKQTLMQQRKGQKRG